MVKFQISKQHGSLDWDQMAKYIQIYTIVSQQKGTK
jgi:hypothetical protein